MPRQVVATITSKPGSEQIVREALAELVTGTRGEPGCLSYALFQSAADHPPADAARVSGLVGRPGPPAQQEVLALPGRWAYRRLWRRLI